MAASKKEPLVQFEKDTILPGLPKDTQMNDWLLEFLSFMQQWGVIICFIFFLICLVQVQLFKARKNPQAQKFWKFTGWGMVFLSVFFAFLPYIVLRFY
jgi:type II secretory pathway component PulF